jgi:hypothetical protein
MFSLIVASFLAAADPPGALSTSDAGTDAPADFTDDVRLLWQVVTCREETPPQGLDAKAIEAFCAVQKPRYQKYRQQWAVTAREFLAKEQPTELPAELVYPFGGGDLMTALTAYPSATTVTTLSLELAGDPRRLAGLKDAKMLKRSLMAIADASASTLISNDSLSKNLSKVQQGELPGQLSMHLMGLGMFDFEPVQVRYFRVEPDGSLHYYSKAEVLALDGQKASSLKREWRSPDFSPAFANVEVQFVPVGQPNAPRRIHRHIAANLSNEGLVATPGIMKHLEAKGRVAAMTKAASYLVWNGNFSTVRDYLTSHAVFMVSDSTGPPPRFWKKAGCTMETFGSFQKSFLGTWEGYQQELRGEFSTAKHLPMRFGYPDGSPEKRNHLIITRCGAAADAGVTP